MLGVEVSSGQICNLVIFSESSKSSHSLVKILLLHKIFRYSRRISQARKCPQFGEKMLQGLNSMLQEKHHELSTQKCTSSTALQLLDAGRKWFDFLHLSFCGRRIPRGQFLHFFGGIKRGNAILVRGRDLPVFDIKPFLPPTLY
jgi:hypothetical protein